jgi:hypothetical protein
VSNSRRPANLAPAARLGHHISYLIAADPIAFAQLWLAAKVLCALEAGSHGPGDVVAAAQLAAEMRELLAASAAVLADQITAAEVTGALAALAGRPASPAAASAQALCHLVDQLEAGRVPFAAKLPADLTGNKTRRVTRLESQAGPGHSPRLRLAKGLRGWPRNTGSSITWPGPISVT